MSTENVIRGHKATISNPNTSQVAKEHSRQVIQELGGQATESTSSRQPHVEFDVDDGEEEVEILETSPSNVSSGNAHHKDAVDDKSSAGKDPNRVIGGYKATLSNPKTSEEAKMHAKAELEQHGVSV